MAKQIVTQEAVVQVCETLITEGVEPSIMIVQERIGGGSYSTVKRYIDLWKQQQIEAESNTSQVPEIVQKKASEMSRAVWLAAYAEANQKIGQIQEDADRIINATTTELHEAQVEITRLEGVEAEQSGAIIELHEKLHNAEISLATITAQANKAEVLAVELDASRKEEKKMAVEIGRLQGENETLRSQLKELMETLKK